jgi:hypothetical protein
MNLGVVVVMENLSSNKSENICLIVEAAGAGLLYLPAYLPDLNPKFPDICEIFPVRPNVFPDNFSARFAN